MPTMTEALMILSANDFCGLGGMALLLVLWNNGYGL